MNRENASKFIPLVQALADGKTLQYHYGARGWVDFPGNSVLFGGHPENYRIKPEPVVSETWFRIYTTGSLGGTYASEVSARERLINSKVVGILHVTITDGVPHAEVLKL